jgi:flagellar motor component MotA
MVYLNAQTMFLLSLDESTRTCVSDLIEEAVQLRASGFSTEEIEARLDDDIRRIEDRSKTPRMVRVMVLGTVAVDSEESGTIEVSNSGTAV